MITMTSTILPFTLTLKRLSTFTKMIVAGMAAFLLLNCPPVHGATLISKAANATVYLGLPSAALEFENPLAGTETVIGHAVLEWRDADYAKPGHPLYDDWTVSDTNNIDGDTHEIWMRQTGQSIWTVTTVPSTILSIHMTGDANDGRADVLVDGSTVASLDMWDAVPGGTVSKMELEHEDDVLVYSYEIAVAGKDGIDAVKTFVSALSPKFRNCALARGN